MKFDSPSIMKFYEEKLKLALRKETESKSDIELKLQKETEKLENMHRDYDKNFHKKVFNCVKKIAAYKPDEFYGLESRKYLIF